MVKKIGILTSGGDAPGMNDAIFGAIRTCYKLDKEIYAIYGGYTIYNQDFIRINYAADSDIIDTTASKITGEHITKGFYESGFFDAEVINGRILYDSFLNASPSDAFRIEFIKFVANQLIEYLEWKIEKQRIIDKAWITLYFYSV